jgi:hypothetical protein
LPVLVGMTTVSPNQNIRGPAEAALQTGHRLAVGAAFAGRQESVLGL